MTWTIKITKTAVKQLKRIDKTTQKRLLSCLQTRLENTTNPRQQGKALRCKQGELWRYRVGDYRLICRIDDHTITILVLAISHCKEIYRD